MEWRVAVVLYVFESVNQLRAWSTREEPSPLCQVRFILLSQTGCPQGGTQDREVYQRTEGVRCCQQLGVRHQSPFSFLAGLTPTTPASVTCFPHAFRASAMQHKILDSRLTKPRPFVLTAPGRAISSRSEGRRNI